MGRRVAVLPAWPEQTRRLGEVALRALTQMKVLAQEPQPESGQELALALVLPEPTPHVAAVAVVPWSAARPVPVQSP